MICILEGKDGFKKTMDFPLVPQPIYIPVKQDLKVIMPNQSVETPSVPDSKHRTFVLKAAYSKDVYLYKEV